jgi:hypothetical protein
MIDSRAKGIAYENEIKMRINEQLYIHNYPYKLERNLEQVRSGGSDLIGLDGFAIECKRYNNGSVYRESWWEQTCKNAKENEIPVLIYRFDRQPSYAVVPIDWFFSAQFETPKCELREHTAIMKFESFLWFLICYLGVIHGR